MLAERAVGRTEHACWTAFENVVEINELVRRQLR
jgi:hypothetical protein